jgi:predicted NAD/FAD-binding protein
VWSTAPAVALAYPARYLFEFLANHGMLSVSGSHPWRTVSGGSRNYVERAVKQLSDVATATPVRSITRDAGRICVRDDADQLSWFDRVVIATHADTALGLLDEATAAERDVLGAFTYSRNETALHTDDAVLPTMPRAKASWNYLLPHCTAMPEQVTVSYDMNRLQSLPTAQPHLVTLNASHPLRDGSVLARMSYTHPIYTRESVAAQRRLAELTTDRVAFAGAYHGWGFHEDGCRSGAAAAAAFGVTW